MDLDITTSQGNARTVVHVSGEIDVYTVSALRDRLDSVIERGEHHLVIDLSAVTFMDSTGLGVLVGRLKLVRAAGGSMRLVTGHERVLKVFAITGLDKVFEIYPTVDDAVAARGA
jgi:anti-sigma B factor antagonist